jgi:CDP-diglyceride synthetase
MVSTKKRKIYLALTFIGIVIFFISVISFMVLAYITNGNVTQTHVRIAWVLFAFIALGSLMSLIGALLFILLNKEKIKDYLKKISN